MVMKSHGNVRGEVRVNFPPLFASKPHIFMRGSLTLIRIVHANVRLNIAISNLLNGISNLGVASNFNTDMFVSINGNPFPTLGQLRRRKVYTTTTEGESFGNFSGLK